MPPFVVIPADAYREHLARAGADGDQTAIREAILGAPLDPGLLGELLAALPDLGPRVAVRSSGTAEDLPGLSFAGQYETVLDVDAPRRSVPATSSRSTVRAASSRSSSARASGRAEARIAGC